MIEPTEDLQFPKYQDIPEKFFRHDNQFRAVAFQLFCEGGHPNEHGLSFKQEVPVRECLHLIQKFMEDMSFEHNHKTAGIAYLLSEWCDAEWEK